MTPYGDLNGNSGIAAYAFDDDAIELRFKRGGVYRYTRADIGDAHWSAMTRLADWGQGLNSYLNTHAQIKSKGVLLNPSPRPSLRS